MKNGSMLHMQSTAQGRSVAEIKHKRKNQGQTRELAGGKLKHYRKEGDSDRKGEQELGQLRKCVDCGNTWTALAKTAPKSESTYPRWYTLNGGWLCSADRKFRESNGVGSYSKCWALGN